MLKRMEFATNEQDEVARALANERMLIDAKIKSKENEIREWAQQQLQENYGDFDRMVNAKQLETENRVKQLLATMKKEPEV